MRRIHLILVSALFVLLAGCGGDSLPERACDRADECNLLDGQTHAECVAEGEAILDSLSGAQRDAFVELIEGCLDLETCADFEACLGN
jgi:hypothetical protein